LQGRYYYLRLHPLTFAEIGGATAADLADLLAFSGFPEPFFSGSEQETRRWSLGYRERLVREEVSALETISDLGKLEMLMLALPDRVGSPLSINSLREALQVSHPTVSRWLDILDRVYAIFRLAPFGSPLLRAVKKERKHHQFDWTLVSEAAARFENLIAVHLLKWAEYQADTQGRSCVLRYFRDIDGREVDFVLTDNDKPIGFVECKLSDAPVSGGLKYLAARFPGVPAWQVSATGAKDYLSAEGIRVCPAQALLRQLV
jgi:predicted AAA+ superfamily ATPase